MNKAPFLPQRSAMNGMHRQPMMPPVVSVVVIKLTWGITARAPWAWSMAAIQLGTHCTAP